MIANTWEVKCTFKSSFDAAIRYYFAMLFPTLERQTILN